MLLDLRPSGPLGAPVARIRLSAKGWPKRTVDGTLDAAGFRVGYYGPGDGSAVTVTAEALDAVDCVLGSGSATVPALEDGATSAPTTLFVRPQPANGCVPDAGRTPVARTPARTGAARTPWKTRDLTRRWTRKRTRASIRPTMRRTTPAHPTRACPTPACPTPTTTPPRRTPQSTDSGSARAVLA